MSLTDEQCDEFRRLPLSFRDMVRAIYEAGIAACRENAVKWLDERVMVLDEKAGDENTTYEEL